MPIRVSYVFELAEQQALNRVVLNQGRLKALNRKRDLAGLAGGLLVTAMIFTVFMSLATSFGRLDWRFVANGLYAALLSLIAFRASGQLFNKLMAMRFFSLAYPANQTLNLEISEDGITSVYGTIRGSRGWPDIREYMVTSEHLLLFIDLTEAYIFPRRAFASDTDFNAAIAIAKERVPGKAL